MSVDTSKALRLRINPADLLKLLGYPDCVMVDAELNWKHGEVIVTILGDGLRERNPFADLFTMRWTPNTDSE